MKIGISVESSILHRQRSELGNPKDRTALEVAHETRAKRNIRTSSIERSHAGHGDSGHGGNEWNELVWQ